MKPVIKVTGAKALQSKLQRVAKQLDRETPSILKQEGRALAVSLGMRTAPYGMGAEPPKMKGRIEYEIRQIYATPSDINAIYTIIKDKSPQLAGAYFAAASQNKTARANQIMAEAGVAIQMLDPKLHDSARGGKRGSVSKNARPAAVVRNPSIKKYIKEKWKTIGVAKAGWYAAALSLGGRVRSNKVAKDGKRSTAEIFPAYVRKAARMFAGLGGSRVSSKSVTIFSSVKHADQALTAAEYSAAVHNARASFAESVRKALREAMHGKPKS